MNMVATKEVNQDNL